MKLLVSVVLLMAFAALALARAEPPNRIVLQPSDAFVCVPYEKGTSCQKADDVRAWILRNGPGDDLCGH